MFTFYPIKNIISEHPAMSIDIAGVKGTPIRVFIYEEDNNYYVEFFDNRADDCPINKFLYDDLLKYKTQIEDSDGLNLTVFVPIAKYNYYKISSDTFSVVMKFAHEIVEDKMHNSNISGIRVIRVESKMELILLSYFDKNIAEKLLHSFLLGKIVEREETTQEYKREHFIAYYVEGVKQIHMVEGSPLVIDGALKKEQVI
jgi:hypothetical protein